MYGAIDCGDEAGAGKICKAFGIPTEQLPAILGFASDIEPVPAERNGGEAGYGKLPRQYEVLKK